MDQVNLMKTILWLILSVFILGFIPQPIKAQANPGFCEDRYLTLINPIRSRNLWTDKSLSPIKEQYRIISSNNFPATWLIQYDVLNDKDLLEEINNFDKTQEKGVFLEVSKDLADKARVIYAHDKPWYSPGSVFLSGYTQSERKRLIDVLLTDFKREFGVYPKSVGAWWIDSYSLEYLRNKYHITSALIVADQKTTDHYEVWGQWWGVPYYPSKANILTPASNRENKQDVVVLQWAQRHPILAFGEDFRSSYSLQANDYTLLGKDTTFFKELVDVYLDCKNPLGQITIGLETGMESIGFINEYQAQLDYLKIRKDIKPVAMEQFSRSFNEKFPNLPDSVVISLEDSVWKMDSGKRENKKFNEGIKYQQNKAFSDYFLPDKSDFLDRKLDSKISKSSADYNLMIVLVILITLGIFVWKNLVYVWISSLIFLFSAYGLLLKSYSKYGFDIFFGPVVNNITSAKLIAAILIPVVFFLIYKKIGSKNILLLFLSTLVFGFDVILKSLRMSWISEKFYLGFATDPLHFIGIAFQKPFNLTFINSDFPAFLSVALLRVHFEEIWDNSFVSLVGYPLAHLVFGALIFLLIKNLPEKIKFFGLFILSILFIIYLKDILAADPRVVLPII